MATPVVNNPVAASTTGDVDIKSFTGEERDAWRKTGELPNREAKVSTQSEDSSTSNKPDKEDSATSSSASEQAKSASASEADKTQEKPRKRSEEGRLKEVLADLKAAGLTPEELKTFRRDATQTKTADPSTANPPAIKALEPPKKPEAKDFADWDKYEAAKEKYFEELADYKAKKAVQEDRQQRAAEAEDQRLKQSITEAKTRYTDFDDVIKPALQALSPTVQDGKLVPQIHPLVEARINRSSVFPDLLYVLGVDAKDLGEFVNLARTDPFAALDKIVVLEQLVTQKLSKAKPNGEVQRGADGKFLPATEKPPERPKVSNAPAPGSEVSGRGSPPPDDVESAVANDDVRAYIAAANRRDLSKIRK